MRERDGNGKKYVMQSRVYLCVCEFVSLCIVVFVHLCVCAFVCLCVCAFVGEFEKSV